jgi:uncharacterized membrane protein YozB (DUF420 family)
VLPLTPHQVAARTRAGRIRVLACIGFTLTLAIAVARYFLQVRATGPSTEDLMPGFEAARARQVSILIGSFGESLLEGWRFVQQPGVQAALLVAIAATVTLLCFRIAWLVEHYAGVGQDDGPAQ